MCAPRWHLNYGTTGTQWGGQGSRCLAMGESHMTQSASAVTLAPFLEGKIIYNHLSLECGSFLCIFFAQLENELGSEYVVAFKII
jgi:hypothetical protein